MTITHVLAVAVLCGCGSSQATAGLANAPRLGTSPSRDRPPYDVVADGRDSCERAPVGKPPEWSRSPPCPAPARPAPVVFATSTPMVSPLPAWNPQSRWLQPACWTPERGAEPIVRLAQCCPPGEALCK
jgi:hypothetical protein